MGTRSNIGYKDKETGTIHFVYCHWDGYYDGVGSDLLSNYPTYDDAVALVQKGGMSTPGEHYADKGEDYESNKPQLTTNPIDVIQEEFGYIHSDGLWLASDGSQSFRPLTELI